MFKVKKITSKTALVVGNYFRYNKDLHNGIRDYKLTSVNYERKRISFSYWDESTHRVEIALDWCTFDEFQKYLVEGLYILVPEDDPELDPRLRMFKQ